MGHETEVKTVGQGDLEALALTVAASFADDPIWKWIYGVDGTIPIVDGLVLARMLVARSTPLDTMLMVSDWGAVALWTAPLGSSDPENDELREAQSSEHSRSFAEHLGDRIALVGQLGEAMSTYRPEESHWYLGILGTHPDRQSRGLGSQVLQAMLTTTDQAGIPTFLESSNPRNYGFYHRHGYVQMEELTVADSPPLRGFWRPAH